MIVAHVFWLMPLHSEEAVKAAGFVSLITKMSAGKQLGTPPDSYPAALAAETLPGDHWDADISSDFICYFLLFTLLFFPPPFRSFPASFPFFLHSFPFILLLLFFLFFTLDIFVMYLYHHSIHLHCFINCFIVLSLLLVHTKQSSSGLAVWLWDCDWILEWTGLFSQDHRDIIATDGGLITE